MPTAARDISIVTPPGRVKDAVSVYYVERKKGGTWERAHAWNCKSIAQAEKDKKSYEREYPDDEFRITEESDNNFFSAAKQMLTAAGFTQTGVYSKGNSAKRAELYSKANALVRIYHNKGQAEVGGVLNGTVHQFTDLNGLARAIKAVSGKAKDVVQPVGDPERAIALKKHEEGITVSQDKRVGDIGLKQELAKLKRAGKTIGQASELTGLPVKVIKPEWNEVMPVGDSEYTKEDVDSYHKKYEQAKVKGDVTAMAKWLTLWRMAKSEVKDELPTAVKPVGLTPMPSSEQNEVSYAPRKAADFKSSLNNSIYKAIEYANNVYGAENIPAIKAYLHKMNHSKEDIERVMKRRKAKATDNLPLASQQVKDLFERGLDAKAIAKKMGFDLDTVERIMRNLTKAGVIEKAKDSEHDDTVTELASRIKQAVKSAKRDGTVGMSKANLRQVVNIRGLRFANPNHFERSFEEALGKAGVGSFAKDATGPEDWALNNGRSDYAARDFAKWCKKHATGNTEYSKLWKQFSAKATDVAQKWRVLLDNLDEGSVETDGKATQMQASMLARKKYPGFGKVIKVVKTEDTAKATDALSNPQSHLDNAVQYEIANDRARALDSYRAAASGFRNSGDRANEAKARDGINACQTKLAQQYTHPGVGKVKVCDSAEQALRTALERTRAGELVRVEGRTVRPGRAKDVWVCNDPKCPIFQPGIPHAHPDWELVKNGKIVQNPDIKDPSKLAKDSAFKKLEGKLSHEKGVTDPAALAASIGRKKYGAAGMAAKSAAGRAKDAREVRPVG